MSFELKDGNWKLELTKEEMRALKARFMPDGHIAALARTALREGMAIAEYQWPSPSYITDIAQIEARAFSRFMAPCHCARFNCICTGDDMTASASKPTENPDVPKLNVIGMLFVEHDRYHPENGRQSQPILQTFLWEGQDPYQVAVQLCTGMGLERGPFMNWGEKRTFRYVPMHGGESFEITVVAPSLTPYKVVAPEPPAVREMLKGQP